MRVPEAQFMGLGCSYGPDDREDLRVGAVLLGGSGSSAHLSRVTGVIEWGFVRTPPMANQLPLGLIIHYNTNIHMEALLN